MNTTKMNTETETLASRYDSTEVSLDGDSLGEVIVRRTADRTQKLAVTSGTITVW